MLYLHSGIEKGADRGAEAIFLWSEPLLSLCSYLVGVAGFEPATPSSRTRWYRRLGQSQKWPLSVARVWARARWRSRSAN